MNFKREEEITRVHEVDGDEEGLLMASAPVVGNIDDIDSRSSGPGPLYPELHTGGGQPTEPRGAAAADGAQGALSLYEEASQSPAQMFAKATRHETKREDDSQVSFGDDIASRFGSPDYSPSAPEMDEDEQAEYQAWLRETSLVRRRKYHKHDEWQEHLKQGGDFPAVLEAADIPADRLSAQFKQKVIQARARPPEEVRNTAIGRFIGAAGMPPSYRNLVEYIPARIREQPGLSDHDAEWARQKQSGFYDEINGMISETDDKFKIGYMSLGAFAGRTIESNQIEIVSDHNGSVTGRHFQVWGPGMKKGLGLASTDTGQTLNVVTGSRRYELNTTYAHVDGRFTITRIADNEMGFCVSRQTGQIYTISPGRYFLHEHEAAYLGKAVIAAQDNAITIDVPADRTEDFVQQTADRIEIVRLRPGYCAFVKDQQNTYVLPYREAPYILDAQRGESFISVASLNDKLLTAADGSYTIVNNLQPGEFVMFQFITNQIIWQYDAEHPELNQIHLPSSFFEFDREVHKLGDKPIVKDDIAVVSSSPVNTLVVRDPQRRVRFIEQASTDTPYVLRAPWRYIDTIAKNGKEYTHGDDKDGTLVARVCPTANDWVAIVTDQGQLEIFPPLLDGSPYYFYQPTHRYVALVDKNLEGEHRLKVDGIGDVSIVNLRSGQLGACRINNFHFLLNPSPLPYLFVSPNAFLEIVDSKKFHTQVGDIHRIYLAPDERAVISKDGRSICLPSQGEDVGAEEQGNGVYIFRSFQLEVYGPEKKNDKRYRLGNFEYFRVEVGEVGFGNIGSELKIWPVGQYRVDNSKQEAFGGFFQTNVDPVVIDNFQVTSKHSITSHIDIFVAYRVVDPVKAIERFRDHGELHKFIATTTQSEMLRLCAERPPIGFTEMDFDGVGASAARVSAEKTDDHDEAMVYIEDSFTQHVNELLHRCGIELSKMQITSWRLDPDFIQKLREIALRLQEQRAQNEQAQIELERRRTESSRLVLEKDSQLELQKRDTSIKAELLEQEKLAAVAEAEKAFAIRAAEQQAEAQTQAAKAKAEAAASLAKQQGLMQEQREQAETDRDVAEKSIEKERLEQEQQRLAADGETARKKQSAVAEAEIAAARETAGDQARAEADKLTAQARLDAAKIEAEARQIEADSKALLAEATAKAAKIEGLAKAEVDTAQAQAKYPGMTAEQVVQLKLQKELAKVMTGFTLGMLKSGVNVPGMIDVNKDFLSAFMSQMALAQSRSGFASMAGGGSMPMMSMFAVPPAPNDGSAESATGSAPSAVDRAQSQ